jgi:pectate lyase
VGFASLNGGTTGGAGGQTVTVTNQSDLENYAGSSDPYIIKVQGTITISPFGKEVNVTSNKTIVGVGADATIKEGGFRIINQRNVIIRNLTIRDTYVASDHEGKSQDYDAIQVDTSQNIWFDHCHFTRGGDGLLDLRKDTDYVTVSWCILSHHNKCWGVGWTDNVISKMTLHHNWIHDTEVRNPSFDNAIGHLYNNFLEDISGYGNWIRGNAIAVIENSYYENVKDPWYVDNGEMVTRGNKAVNCSGRQEGNKGTAFDPSSYYSYTLDPVDDVPNLLRTYAGPSANIQY